MTVMVMSSGYAGMGTRQLVLGIGGAMYEVTYPEDERTKVREAINSIATEEDISLLSDVGGVYVRPK